MTKLIATFALTVLVAGSLLAQDATPMPSPATNTAAQVVNLSLVTGKRLYCVGEAPRFVVAGDEMFARQVVGIFGSHQPYGDPSTPWQNYGRMTGGVLFERNGVAFWSGDGPVFTLSQAGEWVFSINLKDTVRKVPVQVNYCDGSAVGPFGISMNPQSGSILFNDLPTNSEQVISAVISGRVDFTEIIGWRVVIANQRVTNNVNNFTLTRANLLEVPATDTHGGLSEATAVRIPYPVRYLPEGSNAVEVCFLFRNGRKMCAAAEYNVRSSLSDRMPVIPEIPEEKLVCGPNMAPPAVPTDQYVSFWAEGGDGTYNWSSPDAKYSGGFAHNWSALYDKTGPKVVTVKSGSQSCLINIMVLPPPPALPLPGIYPAPGNN